MTRPSGRSAGSPSCGWEPHVADLARLTGGRVMGSEGKLDRAKGRIMRRFEKTEAEKRARIERVFDVTYPRALREAGVREAAIARRVKGACRLRRGPRRRAARLVRPAPRRRARAGAQLRRRRPAEAQDREGDAAG